jgi:hypothetical protein
MPDPDLTDVWLPCSLAVNEIFNEPAIGRALGWPAGPIDVDVRRPDGSLLPPSTREGYVPAWHMDPGAPLGVYTVTARQGTRTVSGTFELLARSDKPIVRITAHRAPDDVSFSEFPHLAGASFRVSLAGFDAGQPVKLLLYRGSHNVGYGFQAVIGTVEMDQRGEGTYLLQTASDDPPGTYSIQTMPGSRGVHFPEIHGGVFCVTRTRDPAECSLSESDAPWSTP